MSDDLKLADYNHPMSLITWQAWVDDLPLPLEFEEGQNALQEYLYAQAAELTRLRAMLTPLDDVQCYTVDALKYNPDIDLPGDMPMVPADLVTRLRARIKAADKLARAVAIEADKAGMDHAVRDALSAYEGSKG